jgi:hypothetical protein
MAAAVWRERTAVEKEEACAALRLCEGGWRRVKAEL